MSEDIIRKYVKKETNVMRIKEYIEGITSDEEERKFVMYDILTNIHDVENIRERIMNVLKGKEFLFHHSKFDEIRRSIKEQEDFLTNPIQVEDGVIECKKCHSFKTFSYSKQTRASDEGTTVFVTCAKCRHSFRLS